MQQLIFEKSWEKQLADRDRKQIESEFQSYEKGSGQVQLQYLWHTTNYKNEILVFSIIHNFTQEQITIDNKEVHLTTKDGQEHAHTFYVPEPIEPRTSMPWTFIFPPKTEVEVAKDMELQFK
ncbi:SLAP domain-containing protein [Halalkalibacillus halophilus]|uniref:SLAP domain-containing protein n=1 Tax=Halalkalibacillus halophilus TaxID=392827 RepID=UPI000422D063|nr:SLAP domain-containing protein [Halalkalibacillus halophilus]